MEIWHIARILASSLAIWRCKAANFCGEKTFPLYCRRLHLWIYGHYTLDCTIHPYVYAFTGYNAQTPPSNTEYFGQHAYFETELDSELLYEKKHLYPSQFHQNATIRLTTLQRKVIVRMLCYAYRNTYPEISVSEFSLSGAPFWMKLGTHLLNDPSGQKKVLSRLIEKIFLGRAFLSPMVASDYYRFIQGR